MSIVRDASGKPVALLFSAPRHQRLAITWWNTRSRSGHRYPDRWIVELLLDSGHRLYSDETDGLGAMHIAADYTRRQSVTVATAINLATGEALVMLGMDGRCKLLDGGHNPQLARLAELANRQHPPI